MSGPSTTAQNKGSKVASADQFTAWQIHYADFARLCNEAANTCEEASRLVQEYSDLCQEQQQYGLSTVDDKRQHEITSSKKTVVEALANNVQMQTHHSQELQRFQKTHEEYAEELGAMQTTLSEAVYLDTDPDVETYLDFLFGSDGKKAKTGPTKVAHLNGRNAYVRRGGPVGTKADSRTDASDSGKKPLKTGHIKVEKINGQHAYVRRHK
ncbi:hypothetical protein SLS55_002819 [Diplodia seriata]|uniref:Uncharacterized protein n=1 Tax=Diplodia seriata TaxID=420778 RepID=A0ABR3CL76_9PEZI